MRGRTLTERVDNLIEIAGRVGIERLGLLVRAERDEKELEQILTRRSDKVFGLLWMCLWKESIERHLERVKRWVIDGPMVGIKLAGYDGPCHWPVYFPVFEFAAGQQAAIFIHSFIKVGGDPPLSGGLQSVSEVHDSRPEHVAALAARLPDTPIIFGHSGGDWELGFPLVRAQKNVVAEISGSYPTRGMVEMAVRELGAERVIYASDTPGRSFSSQLAKVHGARISQRDKELIFAGNLERILTPMFRRKGIKI